MKTAQLTKEKFPDAHHDTFSMTTTGFWIYLMSDCILFSTLFATFLVLHKETFGGPSAKELFSLPFSFAETMILLASSFCCGLGMLAVIRDRTRQFLFWFAITFLLGASFLFLELSEFTRLVTEGNSWRRSAFLSSYFTLVGTHGLHISVGLLWMFTVMMQVLYRGIVASTFRRLYCLSLFWHFLDLVWIFIFSIVYLGA